MPRADAKDLRKALSTDRGRLRFQASPGTGGRLSLPSARQPARSESFLLFPPGVVAVTLVNGSDRKRAYEIGVNHW